MAFDPENLFRSAFKDLAYVFGHCRRDAVANEHNDHCGERHHEAVAAVVFRPKDAAQGRVDNVPGGVEDDFRNGEKEILRSYLKIREGKMEECLSCLNIAFERDLNDVQKRLEKLTELNIDIMSLVRAGFGT